MLASRRDPAGGDSRWSRRRATSSTRWWAPTCRRRLRAAAADELAAITARLPRGAPRTGDPAGSPRGRSDREPQPGRRRSSQPAGAPARVRRPLARRGRCHVHAHRGPRRAAGQGARRHRRRPARRGPRRRRHGRRRCSGLTAGLDVRYRAGDTVRRAAHDHRPAHRTGRAQGLRHRRDPRRRRRHRRGHRRLRPPRRREADHRRAAAGAARAPPPPRAGGARARPGRRWRATSSRCTPPIPRPSTCRRRSARRRGDGRADGAGALRRPFARPHARDAPHDVGDAPRPRARSCTPRSARRSSATSAGSS